MRTLVCMRKLIDFRVPMEYIVQCIGRVPFLLHGSSSVQKPRTALDNLDVPALSLPNANKRDSTVCACSSALNFLNMQLCTKLCSSCTKFLLVQHFIRHWFLQRTQERAHLIIIICHSNLCQTPMYIFAQK